MNSKTSNFNYIIIGDWGIIAISTYDDFLHFFDVYTNKYLYVYMQMKISLVIQFRDIGKA